MSSILTIMTTILTLYRGGLFEIFFYLVNSLNFHETLAYEVI